MPLACSVWGGVGWQSVGSAVQICPVHCSAEPRRAVASCPAARPRAAACEVLQPWTHCEGLQPWLHCQDRQACCTSVTPCHITRHLSCYGCNPFGPGAHLRCAPQHAPEALVKRSGGRAGQALFILIGCKGRCLLVCKTGGGGAWQHRPTSALQGQAPRTGSKDRRAWSSWAAKRGRLLVCKNAGIEGAYQASSQAGANSTASFLPTHSNQADGTPSLRAGTHQQPHTSQQRAEHGQRQGPCWTRCHALRLHHSQTLSGTSPHLHPVAHLPAAG